MNFLDRRVASAGIPSSRSDDWQPLHNYRNSLLHGDSEHHPHLPAAATTVTPKRAYTRKRNRDYQDDEDENDDDDDDNNADPDFRG